VVAVLLGRDAEKSVVDGLLAGAGAGRGDALVIRGDPGIGKTALLDYAATAAGGEPVAGSGESDGGAGPGAPAFRVIRGAGVESEARLPFAGLHVLLGPVLDRRVSLPGPQREALDTAFGLRQGGPRDRFLVDMAVLSLLAGLAADGPLLCLVDDAHWLDPASAGAMVFAARRLGAEGIAVIFAARDHDAAFPAPGLPVLQLGGLDRDSAAGMLAEYGPGLAAEIRCRILAEAQGNPLGLIELCAAYRDHAPAEGPGWAGPPLTERLRQAFGGQVRRLPDRTQTLLLVAAAEDSGDLGVLLAAARALGVPAAATGPAEQAGLIGIADGAVRFRHPLVRAAVYQAATLSWRLAAHRALAEALRDPADADRRAWHRAAATTGPDEGVAEELERTAGEARLRGGYPAAAAAYERAVEFTTDPALQAGRRASAAEARAEAGDFELARALAERAAAQNPGAVVQARLATVRARADLAQGRLGAANRLLVEGAAQITRLEPARAVRMLMYAMHVAWFIGDRDVTDIAGLLEAAGVPLPEPLAPLVELMLRPARQAAERPGDDPPGLAELVTKARQSRADDPDDLTMIALAALVTGRTTDARDLLGGLVVDARAEGKLGWLPTLLACLAQALLFEGRLCDALPTATEALRIAQDTGQPQWVSELNGILAYVAAVQGEQERCRRLVKAALAEPANTFTFAAKLWVDWALGLLELGQGRPDTALVQLDNIWQGPARYHASALRSAADLVEAAARLGQPDRVEEPLARFSAWARRAGTPYIEALAERCEALVAGDEPERHYLAALKLHSESFEQARTQLLYGAWLRRSRRKADARTQLRAAVSYFDRIGAAPWAEQARAELLATGTTTARSDRAGLPGLTPQELQVARLAARGLSNRDIAAQLFLSPRTVGYHLYKAYPKLGITSRNELDTYTLSEDHPQQHPPLCADAATAAAHA
jgi:DNA-binding CsgD family transcriptional regulator